jgi:CRP-like cAMP-binding protein
VRVAKQKLEPILANVPLFESFSRRQIKQLAALTEVRDFMAGHVVVEEGTDGDGFYVVLSGQAKITANGRTVHRVLPGDHFGEISLLDGGPRTATVVTETPMEMLKMTRARFMKALAADPELSMAVLESLARMLRRVDRSLAR